MKTKEFTLSIKLPAEALAQLKGIASDNCSSLSAIARDFIFLGIAAQDKDHCFREHTEWMRAVLTRDKYRCVECGDTMDIQAHHVLPKSQGGRDTLANGKTLCIACHTKAHTTDNHRIPTDDVDTLLCAAWRKAEYLARYQRNCAREQFWQEVIALWMTQRRNRKSPIVQGYIHEHLDNIPLRTLIKTALSLVAEPEALRKIPMRLNGNGDKHYDAPSLVWG